MTLPISRPTVYLCSSAETIAVQDARTVLLDGPLPAVALFPVHLRDSLAIWRPHELSVPLLKAQGAFLSGRALAIQLGPGNLELAKSSNAVLPDCDEVELLWAFVPTDVLDHKHAPPGPIHNLKAQLAKLAGQQRLSATHRAHLANALKATATKAGVPLLQVGWIREDNLAPGIWQFSVRIKTSDLAAAWRISFTTPGLYPRWARPPDPDAGDRIVWTDARSHSEIKALLRASPPPAWASPAQGRAFMASASPRKTSPPCAATWRQRTPAGVPPPKVWKANTPTSSRGFPNTGVPASSLRPFEPGSGLPLPPGPNGLLPGAACPSRPTSLHPRLSLCSGAM